MVRFHRKEAPCYTTCLGDYDVEFVCGRRIIPCHRMLLVAGSPLFKHIFKGIDSDEKWIIFLPDHDHRDVNQLVNFLYGKKTLTDDQQEDIPQIFREFLLGIFFALGSPRVSSSSKHPAEGIVSAVKQEDVIVCHRTSSSLDISQENLEARDLENSKDLDSWETDDSIEEEEDIEDIEESKPEIVQPEFDDTEMMNKENKSKHKKRVMEKAFEFKLMSRDNYRFQCDKCKVIFYEPAGLQNHAARRDLFKMHKCSKCNEVLCSRKVLIEHMKIHRTYLCTVQGCKEVFYFRNNKIRHLKEVHSVNDNEPKPCDICSTVLTGHNSWTKHRMKLHPEVLRVTCEVCGKVFQKRKFYREHLQMAHPEYQVKKQVPCDICNEVFENKVLRKQHIKAQHYMQSQITCEVCGNLLQTKEELEAHMKTFHPEIVRISCDICGLLLTTKKSRNKHKRNRHCEALCELCGFDCGRDRKVMARHVKNKHPEIMNKFQEMCEVCGKGYTSKTGLRCHMRDSHPMEYKERVQENIQKARAQIISSVLNKKSKKKKKKKVIKLDDEDFKLSNVYGSNLSSNSKRQTRRSTVVVAGTKDVEVKEEFTNGVDPLKVEPNQDAEDPNGAMSIVEQNQTSAQSTPVPTRKRGRPPGSTKKSKKIPKLEQSEDNLQSEENVCTKVGSAEVEAVKSEPEDSFEEVANTGNHDEPGKDLDEKDKSPKTVVDSFNCEECGAFCSSLMKYKLHLSLHRVPEIPCHQCDEVFSNRRNLRKHIQSRHMEDNEVYKCKDCSSSFDSKDRYEAHKREHKGVQMYPCPLCGKKLEDLSDMRDHVKIMHRTRQVPLAIANKLQS